MKYPHSESEILELKRQLPNTGQVIKTMVAFCNTRGGKLIIGVEDDLNILGLSQIEVDRILESFDQAIFNSCHPHIIPKVYVRAFGHESVVVIEVSEGMNKPYFIKSEGVDQGTYIRVGRHTRHATPEIIQELKWQANGIDYEKLPKYEASIEDISIALVSSFLEARQSKAEAILDEQILKSYNIVSLEQGRVYPSILGLLMFGKNPQQFLSEAMIICSHFRGIIGRDTIATIDCQGTLFNQFQQAMYFIEQRLNKSFTITNLQREEKLEIPILAIREALLNMIVHRNYHIKAPSKIAIYDDRIEFFSPGRFSALIDQDNLRAGITYLHNPAICKIFREVKYIEKLGSGFITIFDACKDAGLIEPEIQEGHSYIKCILYREKIHKMRTDLYIKDNGSNILTIFNEKELTIQQVADLLMVSRPTAVRKLNRLIADGIVERVGSTKSLRYKICEEHLI